MAANLPLDRRSRQPVLLPRHHRERECSPLTRSLAASRARLRPLHDLAPVTLCRASSSPPIRMHPNPGHLHPHHILISSRIITSISSLTSNFRAGTVWAVHPSPLHPRLNLSSIPARRTSSRASWRVLSKTGTSTRPACQRTCPRSPLRPHSITQDTRVGQGTQRAPAVRMGERLRGKQEGHLRTRPVDRPSRVREKGRSVVGEEGREWEPARTRMGEGRVLPLPEAQLRWTT